MLELYVKVPRTMMAFPLLPLCALRPVVLVPVASPRIHSFQLRHGTAPLLLAAEAVPPAEPDREWVPPRAQLGKPALPAWLSTSLLIVAWYAASIVCNQSGKALLSSTRIGASGLTLLQFSVATVVGLVGIFGLHLSEYNPLESVGQARDTAFLAAIITAGFGLLNACMSAMHVSLVMVLRAAEPAFALVLASALLPSSSLPSPRRAAALLPVIAGAGLSSVGSHAPTRLGMAYALLCNVCFALRGILSKRLAAAHPRTDACSEWLHICGFGVVLQAAAILGSRLALGAALPTPPPASQLPTALLCGVSFFAYVQLSWVCLGRMSAVSHSLCNSLRRPATVLAALLLAPLELSSLNIFGIALACGGAVAYGLL